MWNLPFFRIEREIDDVVDIMKDNIDKTMQRGDRLDDLQDKSGTTPLLYKHLFVNKKTSFRMWADLVLFEHPCMCRGPTRILVVLTPGLMLPTTSSVVGSTDRDYKKGRHQLWLPSSGGPCHT